MTEESDIVENAGEKKWKYDEMANFFVLRADEFPQFLPLVKEAFEALVIAESKLDLLRQCFSEFSEKNKKRRSSKVNTNEECEDSASTIFTPGNQSEPEDRELEPMQRKKKKKKKKIEEEECSCNSSVPPSPKKKKRVRTSVEPLQEEIKSELDSVNPNTSNSSLNVDVETVDEAFGENGILLNKVVNSEASGTNKVVRNSRENSVAPTESSEINGSSSREPKKRKKSEYKYMLDYGNGSPMMMDIDGPLKSENSSNPACDDTVPEPTFLSPGSTPIRVIPSKLLMENPERLHENQLSTPGLHVAVDEKSPDKFLSLDDGTHKQGYRVQFEISNEAGGLERFEESDVLATLCPNVDGDVLLENITRNNLSIAGDLVFSESRSAIKACAAGIKIGEHIAKLTLVNSEDHSSSFKEREMESGDEAANKRGVYNNRDQTRPNYRRSIRTPSRDDTAERNMQWHRGTSPGVRRPWQRSPRYFENPSDSPPNNRGRGAHRPRPYNNRGGRYRGRRPR